MMKLALEEVHQECLEDSFTLIPLKVSIAFPFAPSIVLISVWMLKNLHLYKWNLVAGLSGKIFTVKPLWKGAECWKECLELLSIAEAAVGSNESDSETGEFGQNLNGFIVRRRFVCHFSLHL